MNSWYVEKGPESDVVISSRVRFARNLKAYPFPSRMNPEQGQKVLEEVKNSIAKSKSALAKDISFLDLGNLSGIEKQALVEKHLISPQLATQQAYGGAFISQDEKISIMVNEEDHLRIQCLFPGLQIHNALSQCNSTEGMLEKKMDFAFSSEYGYLTCCPTNLGTGLRASVMMHLPALVMSGYIRGILEACSKLGLAIRGLYGENTEAAGNMFQISNQVTLGQTEEEIVGSLLNVVSQVMNQERMLRSELYKQNIYRFEDKIMRAFGVFCNARIITTEESLKLISDVRLGIDMGIIKNMGIETLNEVMFLIKPASLQKYAGRPLGPEERDVVRAEVIRNRLIQN